MRCKLTPSSSSVWGGWLILQRGRREHGWAGARVGPTHPLRGLSPRPPAVLLRVLLQVGVQLQEAPGRHLLEQGRELVLPLTAVLHQRELEVRAVQQHKLDVEDRLLLLHVISHLRVAEKAHIPARTSFSLQSCQMPCLGDIFLPASSAKAFFCSQVSPTSTRPPADGCEHVIFPTAAFRLLGWHSRL